MAAMDKAAAARPQETEQQRRARKEKEKRKAEEAKRAAAAKAKAGGGGRLPLPSANTGEPNNLKRETAFMCKFRFRNDLPEISGDPKLLVTPFDQESFAKYKVTTLERNHKHTYLTEPDVGVPINLLDTSIYAVPRDAPPPLAPEDEELLAEEEAQGVTAMGKLQRKQRVEHPWLVRTTYISNNLYEPVNKQQGMNEKMVKTIKEKAKAEAQGIVEVDEDDRDHQIAMIEESFTAAKLPPVHAKDPSLVPVEVLEVLPDDDKWGHNYVHVLFDTDPTSDDVKLATRTAEERAQLARFSLLKSYQLPGEDGAPPDRFVAYCVPSDPMPRPDGAAEGGEAGGGDPGASTSAAAAGGAQQGGAAAGSGGGGRKDGGGDSAAGMAKFDAEGGVEYDWVRQYHFETLNNADDSLCFHWGKNAVTYTDLNTKLLLHKKKASSNSTKVDSSIIPESISLKRRGVTEEEDERRADKRLALMWHGGGD